MVALDDAMNALARFDPRKVQVVEMRFFGGLSVEETAEVLKVSPVTVMRDWSAAQAMAYPPRTDSPVQAQGVNHWGRERSNPPDRRNRLYTRDKC